MFYTSATNFPKRYVKYFNTLLSDLQLQICLIIDSMLVVGLGSQYYALEFYKIGKPYNAVENALFACLHRLAFTLPFAITICIYVSSGLGKYLIGNIHRGNLSFIQSYPTQKWYFILHRIENFSSYFGKLSLNFDKNTNMFRSTYKMMGWKIFDLPLLASRWADLKD